MNSKPENQQFICEKKTKSVQNLRKLTIIIIFYPRCINGSTLLHTACYYGHIPAIRELLAQRVDVNLRDYKGATPLHRAKNPEVMQVCIGDFEFNLFMIF